MAHNKFVPQYSFPERLNFVPYHAVINLPHLIIGYNHQKTNLDAMESFLGLI